MKSLKKIEVLFQLSDGSCINIPCFNVTENILFEYDVRFALKVFLEDKYLDKAKINKEKISLFIIKTTTK